MHGEFAEAGLAKSILVYDVGGSHIAAALCAMDSYRLGPVAIAPHPLEQTSQAFVDLLCSLGMTASSGIDHISGAELAVPGPFDLAAGVSRMQHKLPWLYGVNLRQALAERFSWQPRSVGFVNDADAFLLGEIGAGAARGVSRVIGITLGTGIGSAFAVHGRVITEGVGVPPGGEIWNLPYQGATVEDFVSSGAIRRSYERRGGRPRSVVELAAAASEETAASEAFLEFGHHLGQVLRTLISGFEPAVVVLGGAISRSAQLFLPAARFELEGLNVDLRITRLFDEAALVGAAVAWSSVYEPTRMERIESS